MLIRLLKIVADSEHSGHPGQEVDWPAEEAEALIADRAAELVRSVEPEQATTAPRERAVQRRAPSKSPSGE